MNILGKIERASTTLNDPFVVMEYNPETGENDRIGGFESEMMRAIAESINMNIEITLPTDGMFWGDDLDGDGILNGLTGDLQLKKREFGFSDLFIKFERSKVIDFSEPWKIDRDCFLVKKPKPLSKFYALIYPFTLYVWVFSAGNNLFFGVRHT